MRRRTHGSVAAAAIVLALLGAGCAPADTGPAAEPTTVVLVRHAEKAAEPADDPGLTVEGLARARELAQMLRNVPVAALYASEYLRTQATLEPLASSMGLEVTVHEARDGAGLVETIRTRHRGKTVVIAGHSNTVPALIEALGAGPVDPIDESDYDNLYVVTLGSGPASVLRLSFGDRSGS